MNASDARRVLGVDTNADAKAVRHAFLKAAMRTHPDKQSNADSDPAAFRAVHQAYEVLASTERLESKPFEFYAAQNEQL
eukprot:6156717-Prymnesium_polylepis.1